MTIKWGESENGPVDIEAAPFIRTWSKQETNPMASYRKKGNVWYYRFVDAEGVQRERKGHWDLVTTKTLARQDEDKAVKTRAGTYRPETEPEPELIRPLLDQYVATLGRQGRDAKHVGQTLCYAGRMLTLGGVKFIADLTADRILTALKALKDQGLSARTLNAHLTAVKALALWITDRGHAPSNPLASLRRFKLNEKADRRLVRRALSEAELRTLIEATRTDPSGAAWPGSTGACSICSRPRPASGARSWRRWCPPPSTWPITRPG
jgi:hypothetical protein